MADIVDRLRYLGEHEVYAPDAYYEAAEEIERLRTKLAAERERCATIAEGLPRLPRDTDSPWAWPRDIAAAIRKGEAYDRDTINAKAIMAGDHPHG